MITVIAKNGHTIRIIVAEQPLANLDDDSFLYGVAECAGCGTIHAFTSPDELPENDPADDEKNSTLSLVRMVVEIFEKEACVPDPGSDQIVDWSVDEDPTLDAPN